MRRKDENLINYWQYAGERLQYTFDYSERLLRGEIIEALIGVTISWERVTQKTSGVIRFEDVAIVDGGKAVSCKISSKDYGLYRVIVKVIGTEQILQTKILIDIR